MEAIGKYFSKKWDLSDQSQRDDERKKVKERSSACSTGNTDIFGEGLMSADCKPMLFNCFKNLEVKVKEIFDLANANESQIKGEQKLNCLTESVEFISARFDKYEADRQKKDEKVNSLEEKVLGLTEKVDKLSSLIDRQEQYPKRDCILIHGVKENQYEDTDEVVVSKIKNEMDLEISPRDIDRTNRIGVPSKGKNRPIIVKLVRYMERRHVFTNKKRLERKNISISKSLTKIRMNALKEARNKFGYSSVWTSDGKIMYKEESNTKAKIYFDWHSGKQKLFYRKTGFAFDFDGIILFLFVWGIFYEAFQNSFSS